jgi:RNA polymerase sigma-70 factor (ECF subfamily)
MTRAPPEHKPSENAVLLRAATRLYREHHGFVWRNARRLGCTEAWIDDAVHEVFLVATRRLSDFEGRSSERTWLFAITFRVVQRMRRDRSRHRLLLEQHSEALARPGVTTGDDAESAQLLRYLLDQLPAAQQLVLILAELEGFTATEIAETLAIPVGTVHSRLRYAKQQLLQVMQSEKNRSERSKP